MRWPWQKEEPAAVLTDEEKERLQELADGVFGRLFGGDAAPAVEQDVREALKSFAANYGRCPFAVGDWVVKRQGTHGHGNGWPHLVVEVAATPHRYFYLDGKVSPASDMDFGARLDMRVLHRNTDGVVHAHWVESWQFDPMPEPAAAEGDA